MWKSFRNLLLLMMTFAMISCAEASRELTTTPEQDEAFSQLREAARKSNPEKAAKLAESLQDYPIPSYVAYYRLKSDLRNATDAEIKAFLSQYDGTAIADRLRNDWLLLLGERQDWANFDREYPRFVVDDDVQVKCYALMSKAAKGTNVVAEAKELLGLNMKKAGDVTYSLLNAMAQQNQLSIDDAWYFSRLAAATKQPNLASRIATLAGGSQDAVIRALNNPEAFLSKGPGEDRTSHEYYFFALGKVAANKGRAQAVASLNRFQDALSSQERALGWSIIAVFSAIDLEPEAIDYWKKGNTANISPYAHEWRVRTALRHEDWQRVLDWIALMPDFLKRNPTWVYWKGRALKALGERHNANALFKSIEKEHSFYGMLAEEELHGWVVVPASSYHVSNREIENMAETMILARKFYAMNWTFEAVREWNWQLRRLKEDRYLIIAAELAKKIGRIDRMINTSDRTKDTVVISQRFPMPYRDYFESAAEELGLDLSWVYGLVRQESRFVIVARSNVGAQGLMQLMPATAKHVAKRIGMTDYHGGKITDMETNIKLGSAYLDMMLHSLDDSQAMASAGYNAGPGRPKRWKSTLPRAVEGAIFAESIPFQETRDYVKNVLFNATCYAGELGSHTQSLKKRLGTVSP
ncbi:MAG: lytic transglycosylase domain-containing protein [Oxalobacter sp.]|nr:lytic transglycosylase domain-containing protein [Oxalobacter sp.]